VPPLLVETGHQKEWPLSENAAEEKPQRDDEHIDYTAKAQKFYFDGWRRRARLGPQEVVLKVTNFSEFLLFLFNSLHTYSHRRFRTELQTKLANLVLGSSQTRTRRNRHPRWRRWAHSPTTTGQRRGGPRRTPHRWAPRATGWARRLLRRVGGLQRVTGGGGGGRGGRGGRLKGGGLGYCMGWKIRSGHTRNGGGWVPKQTMVLGGRRGAGAVIGAGGRAVQL